MFIFEQKIISLLCPLPSPLWYVNEREDMEPFGEWEQPLKTWVNIMGSHGGFQKTRVQYRDGPSSCHHCSDVTFFLYLAPHRLKLVQKFWGPSVEREPQNPSIPRATTSRSCSAATTRARTGAGGSHTGPQVIQPLPTWVTLSHHAQPSWDSGWEMRDEGMQAWDLPTKERGPGTFSLLTQFPIHKMKARTVMMMELD